MTQRAFREDVEVQFGPVPDAQVDQVDELLDWAAAEVEQRVPDLDARIAAGRTSETLVRRVLGEMVATFLRNPDGNVSASTSHMVGSVQEMRSNTFAGSRTGALELTRRHLRLLGQRAGAQTVSMGDPALVRPLRNPDRLYDRVPGNVWPDVADCDDP